MNSLTKTSPISNALPANRIAAAVLASILCVASSHGQGTVAPSQPSTPHEALSFFEGSWTTSLAKPEDHFKETCGWLSEGRRHMICRSRWLASTGFREGLSIFSFDAESNEYLYHGFRSGGAVVTQRGTRTQNGWIFAADRGSGDRRQRTRVTIELDAAGGFNFLHETAVGEGAWTASDKIVYRRLRD